MYINWKTKQKNIIKNYLTKQVVILKGKFMLGFKKFNLLINIIKLKQINVLQDFENKFIIHP